MSSLTRVSAVYRKELIDILRDRRTLIAMVVIPVVLYPLLLLGFVRMAESEESRLQGETFVVQVGDEATRDWLKQVIAQVRKQGHEQNGGENKNQQQAEKDRTKFDLRIGEVPRDTLGDEIQLHVCRTLIFHAKPTRAEPQLAPRISVEVVYNEVNVRSRTAMEQLTDVFDRLRGLMRRQSLQEAFHDLAPDVPWDARVELILEPMELDLISTATERQRGGWALGQIVPIILVLMTITGAIYPAIDLTAGERERGTLETLMATPVPGLHLIVGKFLVVATIGMLTAALNVASVGATMHFGGLTQAITDELPVTIPLSVLPIIILCMIPFALLFAAILVAVCSFARTFKEAQNYVMPVILAAMIPAIGVTLPTVRLEGAMMVLPVGNMVLLAREMFQQTYTWSQAVVVLLSTMLYAAAAIAIAVRLFGQEAVVFADVSSYRTLLRRRLFHRVPLPTVSQALLMAALLFPASFYINTQLGELAQNDILRMMRWLAAIQFAGLFVILPLLVALFFKIDVVETFRLRLPPARAWFAAVLLGCSSWAMAHELVLLQKTFMPPSEAMVDSFEQVKLQLDASPLWIVLLLLAVVPAVSEEFLFRGFVLSGFRDGLGKWPAIVAVAVIFGVFHFMIDKVPITAALGILLAWLCWQSRSLWPGILFHTLHNGLLIAVLLGAPVVAKWLGLSEESDDIHLPVRVLLPAAVMFITALAILVSMRGRNENVTVVPSR